MKPTFEFVFTDRWVDSGFDPKVDFNFVFDAQAADFLAFLRSMSIRVHHYEHCGVSQHSKAAPQCYAVAKIDMFAIILEASIALDTPIMRSSVRVRGSNQYFASKIIAPWEKIDGDGSMGFCQKVPENQLWPGTWDVATAEPIPYRIFPGGLEVVLGTPKHRQYGWWNPCDFEACRGLHSQYRGYAIKYLPSKKYLMRFAAYPFGSNRAIAITQGVEKCRVAIDAHIKKRPVVLQSENQKVTTKNVDVF